MTSTQKGDDHAVIIALTLVGVRGFELSTPCFSVLAVALCALLWRVRCLLLRSIFPLNVLALLHCCYTEKEEKSRRYPRKLRPPDNETPVDTVTARDQSRKRHWFA